MRPPCRPFPEVARAFGAANVAASLSLRCGAMPIGKGDLVMFEDTMVLVVLCLDADGELALLVRVCDVVAGQTSRWQVRAAISCICLSRWGEAQRATKSLPRLEPPPPEKGGPQRFRKQTYRLGTDGGKKGWRKRGGANREAYAKKFAHLPRGTSKTSSEWKAAAAGLI